MSENSWQIIIIVAATAGWALSATPTLRYIVDVSEGRFRWQLLGWFTLLTTCIFLLKMSLYDLTGWPAPGTWASRLFYLELLLAAYLVPFAREIILRAVRRS
jgi:hypothetical protein